MIVNGETRGKIFAKSEYLSVEGQSSGSSFVMPKMAKLSGDNDLLRLSRRRSVILAISVTLLLLVICLALFLQPSGHSAVFFSRKLSAASGSSSSSSLSSSSNRYAVIFDAGSSGSRVHVFRFDKDLQLVPIGDDLELFIQVKPGLSSYAKDPKAAAESLLPLLTKAQNAVPKELRHNTPVKVGATAGLRLLEGDTSEKILQAVRDLLKANSSLKYEADWVKVLDGSEEGSYMWVSINYLIGSLGKKFWDTVGVVDLGGGSVQMAYAISRRAAGKAPRGNVTYVKKMDLAGTKHYLYVHSYLNYGLLAARAEILKVKGSGNPCTLVGYKGSYTYGGVTYPASASASGSSMNKCRSIAIKALGVHESCPHMKCTFGGVWNGGGGPGQKNLFVASFFYDKASQAGFIDSNKTYAKVRPVDFKKAANRACKTTLKDAKSMYPNVDDLPYLCMDLTYEYTLLVDGFGLHPLKEVTLVQQIKYKKFLVGAAWPLGSAIDVVSSLT